jgi:hypothetical protein
VLDAMQEEFFVGIMGVPNATGLWQVVDIRNNGILKIKWVQAKRVLLGKKRADLLLPEAQRRVPKGEHDKLVRSDVVILLNMVFAPSHCDAELNRRTIALSGVAPFTKCLLDHPEVTQGSGDRAARLAAATDAAAAAAVDVNVGVLGREGLRALAQEKREKERANRGGMQLAGRPGRRAGGVYLGHGRCEGQRRVHVRGFAADEQPRWPHVHRHRRPRRRCARRRLQCREAAKAGGGRGVAASRGNHGGRQGRGGQRRPWPRRPRRPWRAHCWKAVVADKTLQHQDEVAALQAHIRKLEADSAARGGGGRAPAADGE